MLVCVNCIYHKNTFLFDFKRLTIENILQFRKLYLRDKLLLENLEVLEGIF